MDIFLVLKHLWKIFWKRFWNIVVFVLFFWLGIAIIFFGGSYYLVSFLAVQSGDKMYNGTTTLTFRGQQYMLSLKTISTWRIAFNLPDIPMAAMVEMEMPMAADSACPDDFYSGFTDRGFQCDARRQLRIDFPHISEDYDTFAPSAAAISTQPQAIESMVFDFHWIPRERQPVDFSVSLYEFEHGRRAACRSSIDCLAFAERVVRRNAELRRRTGDPMPLYDSTPVCFDPRSEKYRDFEYTGCAMHVQLGTPESCFYGGSAHMHCLFSAFYLFSERPPALFRAVWDEAPVIFIDLLFVWSLMALLFAGFFHLDYLRHYFFTDVDALVFRRGRRYDCKLTLVSEQFSQHSGVFAIVNAKDGECLYRGELRVEFPEEDLDGHRTSRLVFRTHFVSRFDFVGDFEVSWEKEFTRANAVVPDTAVEIRQHVPFGVKTRWNLVFMPLFLLIGLLACRPSPRRLLHYPHYAMVALYIFSVYVVIWLNVSFSLVGILPTFGLHPPIIWGNIDERPVLPMLTYAFMCLCTMLSVALAFFLLILAHRRVVPPPERQAHATGRMTGFAAELGTRQEARRLLTGEFGAPASTGERSASRRTLDVLDEDAADEKVSTKMRAFNATAGFEPNDTKIEIRKMKDF